MDFFLNCPSIHFLYLHRVRGNLDLIQRDSGHKVEGLCAKKSQGTTHTLTHAPQHITDNFIAANQPAMHVFGLRRKLAHLEVHSTGRTCKLHVCRVDTGNKPPVNHSTFILNITIHIFCH